MPEAADESTRELIGALSSIKGAAATVNGRLGVLPPDMARAIHGAAAEVARGAATTSSRPTCSRPAPGRRRT